MISRKHFVNKIRELGYEFKEQLHFQERYRKAGGTHIIHVPRKSKLDEVFVRNILRQAGLKPSEVEDYITAEHA